MMTRRVLTGAWLATLALYSTAWAQPSEAILQGCNALNDADKRMECLRAALQLAKPPAVSSEGVTRAFVGLQGALDSGISYRAYQGLVVDVARELAIFKRSSPPEFAAAVSKLEMALDTYNDAGTFWEAAISFYSRRGNDLAYAGGLPMKMVGLEWMISKQQLPTQKADIWGLNAGVPTDLGRSYMWRKAKSEAEEGLALLKDPGRTKREADAASTAAVAALSTCREAFKQAKIHDDLSIPAVGPAELGAASDVIHFIWGGSRPSLEATVSGNARRLAGVCSVTKSTGAVAYLEIDGSRVDVK